MSFLVLAQAEKVHAVSRRRMAKSSTKRSRSKSNSLPPTKRFDFTMVDDDFEELQRGFAPKETDADTKKCIKFFKDSASARNHHSRSTIKMVPHDILLTDTALQLLEAGGRLLSLLRVRLEDLAILRRLKATYQLQVCNPQPAHSTIQTTCAFSGRLFLVNHLLHAFSGALRTLLHSPSGASCPRVSCSKCNTPLKACSNYYLPPCLSLSLS